MFGIEFVMDLMFWGEGVVEMVEDGDDVGFVERDLFFDFIVEVFKIYLSVVQEIRQEFIGIEKGFVVIVKSLWGILMVQCDDRFDILSQQFVDEVVVEGNVFFIDGSVMVIQRDNFGLGY